MLMNEKCFKGSKIIWFWDSREFRITEFKLTRFKVTGFKIMRF